jgi:tRNA dimethylallyltransferase
LKVADRALEEMRAAEAVPIVVGGTGLYLRGVLKGVAKLPPRDHAYRESLLKREREEGEGALYRLLQETDLASTRRISPRDTQRVVRALELAREGHPDAIGKPGTEWLGPDRYPNIKVGLRRSREELEIRVRAKVDSFFARGLVEETRKLLARYSTTSNAFKALGYREVAAHLRGEEDLEGTKQLIVRNTLRYAKRQMTWFRKEPQVRWFELSGQTETAAPRIRDYVASELGQMTAVPE